MCVTFFGRFGSIPLFIYFLTFHSMTLYLYHMNSNVSTIKNVIWEEKNSIEPEKNCSNNNVIEPKDITNETKNVLTKKVCVDIGNEKRWKRNCPKCNKELVYKSYKSMWNSKNHNSNCLSCSSSISKKGIPSSFKGKFHTKETKEKISHSKFGSIPWNKGKKIGNLSDETKKKMPLSQKNRIIYWKEKISNSHKGKYLSEETKYKLRLATINDLRKKGVLPSKRNYNFDACEFIDKLNKERGWNLQHALNGGEVELYGYFVDGYDKERNIIFEYDEPNHDKLGKKKKIQFVRIIYLKK